MMLFDIPENTADRGEVKGKPGIWHAVYSKVLLLIPAVAYMWAGLTRFIGAVGFPYGRRPQHMLLLAAGALEIALGIWLLFVRRRLIRLKKGAPALVGISALFFFAHYLGRSVLWKAYHQLPGNPVRGSFWVWLAVLVLFNAFVVVYYAAKRTWFQQ